MSNSLHRFVPAFAKYKLIASYHICKVEKLMHSEVHGWFKKAQAFKTH